MEQLYGLKKYDFNPRSYKRSDDDGEWMSGSYYISIHAPTRGATQNQMSIFDMIRISIHAPTRGATAKMHNIPYASLQ